MENKKFLVKVGECPLSVAKKVRDVLNEIKRDFFQR